MDPHLIHVIHQMYHQSIALPIDKRRFNARPYALQASFDVQQPFAHAAYFSRLATLLPRASWVAEGYWLFLLFAYEPLSASCRGFSLQGCPFRSVDRFLSVKGLGVHALIDLPFSLCPSNMCAGDSPSQANLSCASILFCCSPSRLPNSSSKSMGPSSNPTRALQPTIRIATLSMQPGIASKTCGRPPARPKPARRCAKGN